ncbi:MAG: BtpA/SgcQ family protein [Anaerolineaceae bacterium]
MRPSFLTKIDKPVIGMVHLGALPGSVHYKDSFSFVLQHALDEAKMLVEAGFDALLFQNTGDVPASEQGDEATVAFMTAAGIKLRDICPVPLGVNVLMNGSKAALAVARACGAEFVRIKINVGAVTTSTGVVAADPHEVLAFRRRIEAGGLTILGDLYDRTSAPLGEFPLPVLADLTLRHAAADALVVSGYDQADTLARLTLLRQAVPSALLITGGGANEENLEDFMRLSDAVIVGSSIKTGGGFLDLVDPEKARRFVEKAKEIRQRMKAA